MKKIIKRTGNYIKKHNKKFIILLFVCLYIFGLLFISDIGTNNDEKTEKDILRMNIYDVLQNISPNNDISIYYQDNGYKPISQSVEKDHGIAVYYLYSPLLSLAKISNNLESLTWHVYTYSLYFLGVICLYFLSKMFFKKRSIALLTTLMFFFTPRMLIDGMSNNKDSILLSFTIISLYFGFRFIKEKDYKSAVIFGLVSAFACNLKISGIFVFCMIGLFYLLSVTIHKKWSCKTLKAGLLAVICCILLFIIITPAIWGSGFHLFEYINYCLSNSTHFSRWAGDVLFDGTLYDTSKTSLPWYYLPKYIIITTPIYILLLVLISLILFIKTSIKEKSLKKLDLNYLLLLLIPLITIIVAMTSHPNIYNGWRHFYFLYGEIILLAGYALYYISKTKYETKINIVVSIFIGINAIIIFVYGVFCTCYFNILAGTNAQRRYELNYYGIATKTAIQKIADTCQSEKCYIVTDGFAVAQLRMNLVDCSNINKIRLEILEKERAKKYEDKGAEMYYFVDTATSIFNAYKDYKLVYEAKMLGNTVYYIYTK